MPTSMKSIAIAAVATCISCTSISTPAEDLEGHRVLSRHGVDEIYIGGAWSEARERCQDWRYTDEGRRAAMSVNTFYLCQSQDGNLLIETDSSEQVLSIGVLDGVVQVEGIGELEIGQSFSAVRAAANGFDLNASSEEGGVLSLRAPAIRLEFEVESSAVLNQPPMIILELASDWRLREIVVHGYGPPY
jgi:hypothetical protein